MKRAKLIFFGILKKCYKTTNGLYEKKFKASRTNRKQEGKMVFKKRWLFVILASILAFSLLPACAVEETMPAESPVTTPVPTESPPVTFPTPESIPAVIPIPLEEVSLKEVEGIIGVPVIPEYLPSGWKFQRGFVWYHDEPPLANLNLYFSDEKITGDVKTAADLSSLRRKMAYNIKQVKETREVKERTAELYGGKIVDINETKGWLATGPTSTQLVWFEPGLLLSLYVYEEISEEELIKIAQSIK